MRLLRGLGGALLWILASVVGLLGVILCVTVIGLPIGIPLVLLARRGFTSSVRLMLPQKLAHPLKEAKGSVRDKASKGTDSTKDTAKQAGKKAKDATKAVKKKTKKKKSWERRLGL
jgi:hypothetical protein